VLIDQILSDATLLQAGLLTTDLRGRLSKATKFVLRQDFAMAADEFSSDIGNIDKVLKLARLPFPECWFEVAQQDRRLFAQAPIDRADGDGELHRVGFYLTQLDQQGAWSAQLFWSFAITETFMGHHLPPTVSGLTMLFDPQQSTTVAATSFRPAGVDTIFQQFTRAEDWVGEPGFLIATLALLNSRNASATELVEPVQNKRRKLNGKPLLFNYHLVSIPNRYKHRNMAADGDPCQLRAHFVRGHFKLRKTGLYFWSAYQRGNPALGFAHKDYVLHRPPELRL
jgi:hypothetical protein